MGGLVWFMQLGFAFLGAGFIRQKNQVNYWTKSYIDFSVGVVIFALIGFGLMFGGSGATFPTGFDSTGAVIYTPLAGLDGGNSFIGWSGFALTGDSSKHVDISVLLLASSLRSYISHNSCRYGCRTNEVPSIPPVHSTDQHPDLPSLRPLGLGWRLVSNITLGVGVRDFAGSGVVHAVGGFTGLAACWLVGPRIGKYGKNGEVRSFGYTNVPYIVMGTMVLFLGWFGFNPGSTLSTLDGVTPLVAVTTYLAGGIGAVMGVIISYLDRKHFTGPDIQAVCTGALAGLVAVTASCAYVDSMGSTNHRHHRSTTSTLRQLLRRTQTQN